MNYFILYITISLCFTYILNHQLKTINLISKKTDLKLRTKINKKQEQLKLYIKLCPVWPALLIKELYDEIKERRQS